MSRERLAELDGTPVFPGRVPWKAAAVRPVLKRLPRRKAPGLDGWRAPELRLLPHELCLHQYLESQGGNYLCLLCADLILHKH